MTGQLNIAAVLDQAVRDISKRVARLELTEDKAAHPCRHNIRSLITIVQGDYILAIVLSAGEPVMRAITENMKRGGCTQREMEIYTIEYFNILCGHVVTAINKQLHVSARFGIPHFVQGKYHLGREGYDFLELPYQTAHGPIEVQAYYRPGAPVGEPSGLAPPLA